MVEESGDKPKIIVDEDWKSKVQAEKDALERAKHEPSQSADTPAAQPSSETEDHAHGRRQFPPATLSVLMTTLATEAMLSLGQMQHPISNKIELDLEQAKHFIDSLQMLEEKTAGNRTPEESRLLDGILYELRMAFVEVQSRSAAAAKPR
jgi:hypothetical protein